MHVLIHLPRQSEAEISPRLTADITIKPRFYKKIGWVPIFYFTTVDAKGNEERHALYVSAGTKYIRVEKLVEVIPACDEDKPKAKTKDADEDGQTDDTAAED